MTLAEREELLEKAKPIFVERITEYNKKLLTSARFLQELSFVVILTPEWAMNIYMNENGTWVFRFIPIDNFNGMVIQPAELELPAETEPEND